MKKQFYRKFLNFFVAIATRESSREVTRYGEPHAVH